MRNKSVLNEIVVFLESFSRLVILGSKDGLKLSLDDIYYLEYCKVKAQKFIGEIQTEREENRLIKNELGIYEENLRVIIEQINVIEKVADKREMANKNKIDNNITDYEYSVRKPGNKIYSEPYLTEKRDIVNIYTRVGYVLMTSYLGLGAYLCNWSNTLNVAETFGALGAIHLGVMGVAAKIVDKYSGKFNFKRYYENKQKFIGSIFMKVIMETNKKEYMYLSNTINKGKINNDNVFTVYYALAKIESMGEYINGHSDEKGDKFEYNKFLESQLRELHNLISGGR